MLRIHKGEVTNMKKHIIVIGTAVLFLIVGLSGCTDVCNIVNPPDADIISESTRDGYEGLDYVVYIDVTVYNQGGDGKATVWAKLLQDNNQG